MRLRAQASEVSGLDVISRAGVEEISEALWPTSAKQWGQELAGGHKNLL